MPRVRDVSTIRRLDWRFLLPGPARGRCLTLVGAGEAIQRLADTMELTARGDVQSGSGRPAVAILSTGSRGIDFVAAGEAIAAADVVWWEVDRLSLHGIFRTPGRLRRYLSRAGFPSSVVYWAKGGHGRCTMYLPLATGAAANWYFGSRLDAREPIRLALSIGARALNALGPGALGALVPGYGVVAWREAARPPCSGVLTAGVRAEAIVPPSEAATLLYGEGDWSRVVHVPFAEDAPTPTVAVKHPRIPRFNPETSRERDTLIALRPRLGDMRDAVPDPLAEYEADDLRVVVERWIAGRPMRGGRRGRISARSACEELGSAGEWLRAFHRRTAEEDVPLHCLIPALVDGPASDYLERVGNSPSERDLFSRFRKAAHSLGELRIQRVMEHRDFGPWNLHRTARGLVTIDWEVAERGFPLCDLLYFGMHWGWIAARAADRTGEARWLEALLLDHAPGELGDAVRKEVARYLAEMRLDGALVPILMVHLLARQAIDVVDRGAQGPRPAIDLDNRYAIYLRALAPRGEELFAPGGTFARGSD